MINELIFKQIGAVDYHFVCDKTGGLILSKVKNNVVEKSEVIYPFAVRLVDGCVYEGQLYIICQNRENDYMLIKYENPQWHKFDLFSCEYGSIALLSSHLPHLLSCTKTNKNNCITLQNLSEEKPKPLSLALTQNPFLFDCASTNTLFALCHINLQGELFATYYNKSTMEEIVSTPLFKGQHITEVSCSFDEEKLYTLIKSGSHYYLIFAPLQKKGELRLYDMGNLITAPMLFSAHNQMYLVYLKEGLPHARTVSHKISKGALLCEESCSRLQWNKTVHQAATQISPVGIGKNNKIISFDFPI